MNPQDSRRKRIRLAAAALGLFAAWPGLATNVDPAGLGDRFVHGENIGWINLAPTGSGVSVGAGALSGFAWAENVGWINLAPAGGGVVNDGNGHLSGFAWGENVGWINFGATGGGARVDACGRFGGYAWGENVGWIFLGPGTRFVATTAWRSPLDDVPPVSVATAPAPNAEGWFNRAVTVTLAATDCGDGVREIRTRVDARPESVQAGAAASVTVSDEGLHTLHYAARDLAGNAEAPRTLTLRIDRTPPQLVVERPTAGRVFAVNEAATAVWTASDALSGISFVDTPVDSGAALPTATAGPWSLVLRAVDRAGNSAVVTRNYSVMYPGNIDPGGTGEAFAWAENAGWINLRPAWGPGVEVTHGAVRGFAWSENVGWINLAPTGAGVANDGSGRLSGFAWGENIGWIDFGPAGGGVTIDPVSQRLSGFAYAENLGWIGFSGSGSAVVTAWQADDTTPPRVTPPAATTIPATEAGGARVGDSAALFAWLSGGRATDAQDPAPRRLPTWVAGGPVDDGMLLPIGATSASFRFEDRSGNLGSAPATVSVIVGTPRVAGTIAGKGMDEGDFYVDLWLASSGTGQVRGLQVADIVPKTLAGTGSVTLNARRNTALPLAVPRLDVGQRTLVRVYLDLPATVTRFSLTESGSLRNVQGLVYRYAVSQSVTP